ncbi:MAG: hypothetical protein K0S44_1579 [Bacteroidetes bacterium]|jgi:hypothetical protein|nr:hypothetical protein [Bacteroidota bacterium]
MKKIYIFAFAALLSTAGIAQKGMLNSVSNETEMKVSTSQKTLRSSGTRSTRASQALIWSDDFSTPSNWTMTNTSLPVRDWEIVNTMPANLAPATMFGPTFNSVSGGNFAVYNSDGQGASTAIDNASITTALPINLTGYTDVILTFNQYYAKYADVTTVQISSDGLTWTDFVVNSAYAQNNISTNPELVTVDITSAAGNQATVWVRFTFEGAWDYAWMIDDIAINASLPNAADMRAIAIEIPSGCNLGAAEQVNFWVKNNGTAPATGFDVRYIVNGGTPVVETYTGVVQPGDTAMHTFAATLNMTTPGYFDITGVTTITGDANINNDSTSYFGESVIPTTVPYMTSFENTVADLSGWTVLDADTSGATFGLSPTAHTGTQSIWAFENNIAGTSNDWAFSRCIDLVAATPYRVSFWSRLTTGYEGGLGVSVGMMPTVAGMTQTVKAVTALAANSTWVLDSADFMVSTTGTYHIGLNAVNTNATNDLSIRIDDFKIVEVVSGVGINEASSTELSVYPSPSTGVFTVNVAANSSIEVYNLIGKRIYSNSVIAKGINTLDLSGFADGAYFLKVISGSKVSTQKIVIAK